MSTRSEICNCIIVPYCIIWTAPATRVKGLSSEGNVTNTKQVFLPNISQIMMTFILFKKKKRKRKKKLQLDANKPSPVQSRERFWLWGSVKYMYEYGVQKFLHICNKCLPS